MADMEIREQEHAALSRLRDAIIEAQKAYIDKYKCLPPSVVDQFGHDEWEFGNYQVKAALLNLYLLFLRNETP